MNRSMMCTSVLAAAVAMPVSLFGGEIDTKSRELLESVAEFYSAQTTISGRSMNTFAISSPAGNQDMEMACELKTASPNKLHLSAKSRSQPSFVVISDGANMWLNIDAPQISGKYVETEAPSSFQGVIDHKDMRMLKEGADSMFMVLSLMNSEGIDQYLEDIDSAEYLGTEDVNGESNHHIKLMISKSAGPGMTMEVPTDMWFRAGDEPSITKVVPDMSEYLQPGMTADISYAYSDWSFGEDLAEDTFKFTPAEGDEKFASLPALLGQPEPVDPLVEGDEAPMFELESLDGGTVSLAALKGKKVIVLDFWATWCGPCIQGLPTMVEVTNAFKDKGVVFYAVNLQEDNDKVNKFLDGKDYTLNVLMDREGKVAQEFGVGGIPHSVVIGLDGKIADLHIGFSENMKSHLTETLNEAIEATH